MPIYDNDGTTEYEIGKVYDYNGTTWNQIGKIYDNDGTTDTLIYNAEAVVIGPNADYTGGWTLHTGLYLDMTASTGSITSSGLYNMKCVGSYGNHDGAVNVYSTEAIDLTAWDTLTLTYYIHGSDVGGPPPEYRLILANNTSDYTFYGGNSAGLKGDVIHYQGVSDDGAGVLNTTLTATIDISSYSGAYYLDLYARAGLFSTSGKTAQWDVTGLVLS